MPPCRWETLQHCFDSGQGGVDAQVVESKHRTGDLDGAARLPQRNSCAGVGKTSVPNTAIA